MNTVWLPSARTVMLLALALPSCDCRYDPPDSTQADSSIETGDTTGQPDDTQDPGDAVPVALVADGGNQRYVYVRLDTTEVIYEIDMRETFPQLCVDPYECVAFGSEASVDPETGEDLALIISYITHQNDSPRDPGVAAQLRLAPEGPAIDWQLSQLDFVTNFPGQPEICAQTIPCVTPEPVGSSDWQDCTFRNAHAVEVVEETEDDVTMWLADTGSPARALKVRLDKDSVCGVVEEVVGEANNDDWVDSDGNPSGPNDLDLIEWDGQEALLMNHLTQAGADTLGVSTLWVRGETDWELVYKLPKDGGHFMGGHNSDMATASDGERYHVFAHGNGNGATELLDHWDDELDHRGSVQIHRIEDGEPAYLMDATAPEPGFSFIRDADLLADDTFLVTDSGCMNTMFESCDRDAALWHVSVGFQGAEGQGLSGAFSEDHAQQTFVEATLVEDAWPGRVTCGFLTPYESDLLWSGDLGSTLTEALEAPIASCGE